MTKQEKISAARSVHALASLQALIPAIEKLCRCCETCDHTEKDGYCSKYDARPPAEVAANGCDAWSLGVPF